MWVNQRCSTALRSRGRRLSTTLRALRATASTERWTGAVRSFNCRHRGWVVNSEDIFEGEINKQVAIAIEEADEILFVVDAMNGVTDLDDKVAAILRRSNKPVILVANKCDSNEWRYNSAEFYSFGLGDPFCLSAISGSGTGDLLDEIMKRFPPKDEIDETVEQLPRFAIVGRPNAGNHR